MSIVTKRGDRGLTCLYKAKPVPKDHIRIEACGTLDELNSCLGLAKSFIKNKNIKKILKFIQQDLFLIGTEVVTSQRFLSKLKKRINNTHLSRIEEIIKQLEKRRKSNEACFSLPGENPSSGSLHLARTISRRAERRVTTLKRKKILKNSQILIYLNRLSDLLYLLAKYCEKRP